MKTMIAVPCLDYMDTEFVKSLLNLKKPGEVIHRFVSCSMVYQARNDLAYTARAENADYVLWLDSDMIFPETTLEDMIKSIEGKDMLAGVCHMRRPPFKPVLFKKLRQGLTPDENESEEWPDYPIDKPFEVEGCGFGCVLVRGSVLKDVIFHYRDAFSPLPGYGEDLSFCIRARKLGYHIWCDPAIQIGHKGATVITGQTFDAWRKAHPEGRENG